MIILVYRLRCFINDVQKLWLFLHGTISTIRTNPYTHKRTKFKMSFSIFGKLPLLLYNFTFCTEKTESIVYSLTETIYTICKLTMIFVKKKMENVLWHWHTIKCWNVTYSYFNLSAYMNKILQSAGTHDFFNKTIYCILHIKMDIDDI